MAKPIRTATIKAPNGTPIEVVLLPPVLRGGAPEWWFKAGTSGQYTREIVEWFEGLSQRTLREMIG